MKPWFPLRRFAARPDLLTDPAWRAGLSCLRGWDVACGLEVFAHQLPELLDVVRLQPDIRFTFSVLGWPLDLTAEGRERWGRGVAELSRCENVCADISAVECVLGLDWRVDVARPSIRTLIDVFGPDRCMLGSHLPIARLARGAGVMAGYAETEVFARLKAPTGARLHYANVAVFLLLALISPSAVAGLLLVLVREAFDVRPTSSRSLAPRVGGVALGHVPGIPEEVERAHVVAALEERVLADDGVLHVLSPHWQSIAAVADPTHVKYLDVQTFKWFCGPHGGGIRGHEDPANQRIRRRHVTASGRACSG